MDLTSLNEDVFISITSLLDIRSVMMLTSSSNDLYQLISKYNIWRYRFMLDFEASSLETRDYNWEQLYKNYNVKYFGSNEYGIFNSKGGSQYDQSTPISLNKLKFKDMTVSCHIIGIDLNNNVWAFGCNSNGQLGLDDNINRTRPIQIPNIKAKQVSAGYWHTAIIDLDDNIWCCGNNCSGQLGLYDKKDRLIPTMVPNVKAKQVVCGGYDTYIIDINDNVWGFGRNNGESFRLISTFRTKQIAAGYLAVGFVDFDNNIWIYIGFMNKKPALGPIQIGNFKAKQISVGEIYAAFIDLDNNVWMFELLNRKPIQITNIKAKYISIGYDEMGLIDLEENVWIFSIKDIWIPTTRADFDINNEKNRRLIPKIKATKIIAGYEVTAIIEKL